MAVEISPERLRQAKVTLSLIALNVLIFIIVNGILGQDVLFTLAQNNMAILQGRALWGLVTSIFVHANFMHLFGNMIGLLIYGLFCEQNYRRGEFMFIYLVSGLVGSLFSLLFYVLFQNTSFGAVYGLGSSGAIFGIMAATYYRLPRHNNRFYWIGIIYVIYTLLASLTNWAHIFGFASGLLIAFLVSKRMYSPQSVGGNPEARSKDSILRRSSLFSRNKAAASKKSSKMAPQYQNPPEAKIFDRFVIILQTEGAVSTTEMAGYLRIDEIELMKRLVIWKKKLPFQISGDFIVIEDMTEFLKALEKLPS